jgi:hypothetical protein
MMLIISVAPVAARGGGQPVKRPPGWAQNPDPIKGPPGWSHVNPGKGGTDPIRPGR